MTPQTLMNDLTSQNCDVMDIILLIVGKVLCLNISLFSHYFQDEAHRATGDYAYNQIVRYMMAKNPHFRLIALTATPGKDPEAVQNLVEGLHISRIEIRNEESIDLQGYMHDKVRY
jgi:ATP-dependent DNA helicase MPH1